MRPAHLQCPVCGANPGVTSTGYINADGEPCSAGPWAVPSWEEGDAACAACGVALVVCISDDGEAYLSEKGPA